MVLDELKLLSDDSQITEDHVIFLLSKYRSLILRKTYSDIRNQVPLDNYQTICLDLIQVPAISGEPCEGGIYLRSKEKVPILMNIGAPRVYPIDYYQGEITYISRERMRYVGFNKYLQNIIYCSIGPDNYLYFKSSNPQYLYLEKVKFTGIFMDSKSVSELSCEGSEEICDIMDKDFPIEDSLVQVIIELVVKELSGSIYRPDDEKNDAKDNLTNLSLNQK